MDRKALLKKILEHLDEALYAMEISEAKPDDEDAIWNGIMAVHGTAEAELNRIIMDNIRDTMADIQKERGK